MKRTTIRAYGPKSESKPSGNYREGRLKRIRLVVIHSGETGEGSTAAEGMGNWFANPAASGSAHIGVDSDSACRYVDDNDTAFGAQGANADGLHLEHAGRAGQTTSQWADAYSKATLDNGSTICAEWAVKYDIPARWLTDAQLRDGVSRGFTTHEQCKRVFGGSHWDPGPNFPKATYMGAIAAKVARLKGVAPPVTTTKSAALVVDGSFGPKTITAFQAYLKRAYRSGIAVDGSWGPSSRRYLEYVLNYEAKQRGWAQIAVGGSTKPGVDSTHTARLRWLVGVTPVAGPWNTATTKALQIFLNRKNGY